MKSFYNLEKEYKLSFNGWDEKIEDLKSRPDGFIIFEYKGKMYIIFKEIDEHRHDDRSIAYEQVRITMLTVLAKRLGFEGIYFVRMNTAERKEIDPSQQKGVAGLLWKIQLAPQLGVHAWYVDFPINHHHVLASQERVLFEGADVATGNEDSMKPIFNSVKTLITGCQCGI